MTLLQFVLIQVILVFMYLVYLVLSRKTSSLTFNRVFLICAPLIAIAVPFLPKLTSPAISQNWSIELPSIEILSSNQIINESSSFPWISFIYFSGVFISLIAFAYQIIKVYRVPRNHFLYVYRGSSVYLLKNNRTSFSFFNTIYLSESQLAHSDLILTHENAHCRGLHSQDLVYMSLIKALIWFNPIVYLWDKRVKENHEFIADRSVLDTNVKFEDYATRMVSINFDCGIPILGNGFNAPSLLRRRIQQMKHKNKINMKHYILVPGLAILVWTTASLKMSAIEPSINSLNFTSILSNHSEPDRMPEFPGGFESLANYISANVNYPEEMIKAKIEAKIYLNFVVSEDGKVKDVTILRGAAQEEFNKEGIRLVENMPNWIPGVKDGKRVSMEVKLPLVFKL